MLDGVLSDVESKVSKTAQQTLQVKSTVNIKQINLNLKYASN